jgi:hypothetical protein
MRLTSYFDLLAHTCALAGISAPEGEDLQVATSRQLHRFLQRRLRLVWEMAWWAETMRSQERFYRRTYSSTTAYTAGTEVYFPLSGAYYRAVNSTTGNAPATGSGPYTTQVAYWWLCADPVVYVDWAASTSYSYGAVVRTAADGRFWALKTIHTSGSTFDSTNWTEVAAFDPYISLDQTDQDAIGKVRLVSEDDPLAEPSPRRTPWEYGSQGIEILGPTVPASVYVWFQLPPPALTGADFVAASTYAVGATIYYASATVGFEGDYYTCVTATTAGQDPEDTAAKWEKQEIPLVLRDAIAHYAAADYLRTGPNRADAYAEEQAADVTLARTLAAAGSTSNAAPRFRAA